MRFAGTGRATDATRPRSTTPAYVAAVHAAWTSTAPRTRGGLGTPRTPVFPGMHEASARAVRGSLDWAEAVW